MSEIIVSGKWIPFPEESPNHASRPRGMAPQVIVLHSTGGAFAGAVSWLKNPESKASAHFVVARSGEIVQLVKLADSAWHAGTAEWNGHGDVNSRSIGIEMEHVDGAQDWPKAQVAAVAALCRVLCLRFHIPMDLQHLVGHNEVCLPEGRKVDPTGFPWVKFLAGVKG